MSSSHRPGRLAALWLGGCALALTGAAQAAPAPPFAELLRRAQVRAPLIAETNANLAAAEGMARQAAARPNPVLGAQVENFSGGGPYSSAQPTETTATVQQLVELGGKRSARIFAGRAEIESARGDARSRQASFGYDLVLAYAQAEAAEKRIGLAEEALALAQEDERLAKALVDAGREADLRQVQARAGVQSARAGVNEAKASSAAALGVLTSLAGETEPFTSVPSSLLSQAAAAPAARPDPTQSPAFLAARAARNAAAARVRVEQTKGVPDVTVSAGVRRFEVDGSTAMVAGVSLPFPVFDRNRGAISAAQAELRAAEARVEAARLEAGAEANTSVARIAASASRRSAAKDAETAADEAYRLTRIAYEGGKLDLVELLAARRTLTDARAQSLAAAVEQVSAQAALARLQGRAPFGDEP